MTLERKTGQKEKEKEQKKKLSISVKQQQREEYPITYSISFVTARAVYTDTPTTSMWNTRRDCDLDFVYIFLRLETGSFVDIIDRYNLVEQNKKSIFKYLKR